MSRKKDQPGTFELLSRLPGQIATLVRIEYENAKREIFRALKKIGVGAIFLVIALFFLFWAIAAFGFAAIAAINIALPMWVSALIVAGGLVLLTIAAVLVGLYMLKRGNPVPEETISRVTDDVLVASSIKYNANENVAAKKVRTAGSETSREGK